jgi:UDP-4-amino-4-deoxy-L-arabinose formyltransferase/UDP-glucuronic acid dehydrogenase (UDP-4-keto-hexauronic acid decarboxylating)
MLTKEFERHALRDQFPPLAGMQEIESKRYYGDGYEDVQHRRPSIANAKKYLDWQPGIPVEVSIRKTLDYFLRDYVDGFEQSDSTDRQLVSVG